MEEQTLTSDVTFPQPGSLFGPIMLLGVYKSSLGPPWPFSYSIFGLRCAGPAEVRDVPVLLVLTPACTLKLGPLIA